MVTVTRNWKLNVHATKFTATLRGIATSYTIAQENPISRPSSEITLLLKFLLARCSVI